MKNITTGLVFILFLSLLACGPTTQADQNTETEKTEETNEATTDTNAEPSEETSSKPSPPKTANGQIAGADIVINYSSPAVKGRKIWGGLEPFGEVWRTGANKATTFELSQDLNIEGQTLAAGKYGLFTIPNEDKWVIIFNAVHDQWGDYDYDEAKDVLRVEVTPKTIDEQVERMEFVIRGEEVALRWDKLEVAFKAGAKG